MSLTAIKYKKRIENELANTEIVLNRKAILSANGSIEKTLPRSKKNGAPGGCGTWRENPEAINSPQSQNETEGCTVKKRTTDEIAKTIAAIILFRSL